MSMGVSSVGPKYPVTVRGATSVERKLEEFKQSARTVKLPVSFSDDVPSVIIVGEVRQMWFDQRDRLYSTLKDFIQSGIKVVLNNESESTSTSTLSKRSP